MPGVFGRDGGRRLGGRRMGGIREVPMRQRLVGGVRLRWRKDGPRASILARPEE